MPIMNGFELYNEIKKIDYKMRVCFISALEVNYQALRELFGNSRESEDMGCFIRKPIGMDDLIQRIEKELE